MARAAELELAAASGERADLHTLLAAIDFEGLFGRRAHGG